MHIGLSVTAYFTGHVFKAHPRCNIDRAFIPLTAESPSAVWMACILCVPLLMDTRVVFTLGYNLYNDEYVNNAIICTVGTQMSVHAPAVPFGYVPRSELLGRAVVLCLIF